MEGWNKWRYLETRKITETFSLKNCFDGIWEWKGKIGLLKWIKGKTTALNVATQNLDFVLFTCLFDCELFDSVRYLKLARSLSLPLRPTRLPWDARKTLKKNNRGWSGTYSFSHKNKPNKALSFLHSSSRSEYFHHMLLGVVLFESTSTPPGRGLM